MKRDGRFLAVILGGCSVLSVLVLAQPSRAQTHSHAGAHHHSQGAVAPAASTQATDWTRGEIRRIDRDNARVTVRHEEIRSLDMPPMTMIFSTAPGVLTDALKPGDRVRFRVVGAAGQFTITELSVDP